MFWIIPLSKKKAWKIANPLLEGPPHIAYLHTAAFTEFPFDGLLQGPEGKRGGSEL